MRELNTRELNHVSGGTSIYDHREQDVLNTGNPYVDLVNAGMLVATGELSSAQFSVMYPGVLDEASGASDESFPIGYLGGSNFGPDNDMSYTEYMDWVVQNPAASTQYGLELLNAAIQGNVVHAEPNPE